MKKVVSIHAPTRGATAPTCATRAECTFQSTLPHGERRARQRRHDSRTVGFNPRSHTGSDLPLTPCTLSLFVSIHAPTRGATAFVAPNAKRALTFQSTLPHGERPLALGQFFFLGVSIHAPTRGATFSKIASWMVLRFQSTLPHGERQYDRSLLAAGLQVSIHAPTRGATRRP